MHKHSYITKNKRSVIVQLLGTSHFQGNCCDTKATILSLAEQKKQKVLPQHHSVRVVYRTPMKMYICSIHAITLPSGCLLPDVLPAVQPLNSIHELQELRLGGANGPASVSLARSVCRAKVGPSISHRPSMRLASIYWAGSPGIHAIGISTTGVSRNWWGIHLVRTTCIMVMTLRQGTLGPRSMR